MLHFTSWESSKLELGKIYFSPLNESNYWSKKLTTDWVVQGDYIRSVEDIANSYKKLESLIPSFSEIISNLKQMLIQSKYSSELLKEYIFEEIRLSKFNGLPSRKKCMFLVPDDSDIEEIRKSFLLTKQLYPSVVRIEGIKGKHVKAEVDACFLNCNSRKHNEICGYATNYWECRRTEKPLIEILFEGEFKIIEIIEP